MPAASAGRPINGVPTAGPGSTEDRRVPCSRSRDLRLVAATWKPPGSGLDPLPARNSILAKRAVPPGRPRSDANTGNANLSPHRQVHRVGRIGLNLAGIRVSPHTAPQPEGTAMVTNSSKKPDDGAVRDPCEGDVSALGRRSFGKAENAGFPGDSLPSPAAESGTDAAIILIKIPRQLTADR